MDLKGCRNVFLLVTLGAAAMIGGNPTIIADTKSNGGVMLTCTYEDAHPRSWDIKIRWSHPGASKLITRPGKSEYPQFTSAIDIQPNLVTYQNIGTLYYSCIVAIEEYDGWNDIILYTFKLERWVLSMNLVKAAQMYPVINMDPENVLVAGNTVRLTCEWKKQAQIKWYLRGGLALVEHKSNKIKKVLQQTFEQNVTEEDNGAEYICIIKDDNGDAYFLSKVLEVKPKAIRKAPPASESDPTFQAVTLTLIFILVAAGIVLAVFLIRMKRNITGKPPEESGTQPHDDFDEYAHPGGPSRSDDIYRSLGKGGRFPGQMNAAFEPEGADYIDVLEKDGQPMTSDPQGRLEDGLRDGTTDTPVYMVLDPDAVAENDEEDAAIPSLYDNEGTGIATSSLGGGGAPARIAPSAAGKGRLDASDDASEDYAEPDGSFPSVPKAFPNCSNAGHDQPATEEDNDYTMIIA